MAYSLGCRASSFAFTMAMTSENVDLVMGLEPFDQCTSVCRPAFTIDCAIPCDVSSVITMHISLCKGHSESVEGNIRSTQAAEILTTLHSTGQPTNTSAAFTLDGCKHTYQILDLFCTAQSCKPAWQLTHTPGKQPDAIEALHMDCLTVAGTIGWQHHVLK